MNTRGYVQSVLVALCLAFVSCDPPDEGVSVTAPKSISVVDEYLNLPPVRQYLSLPDKITTLGRVLFYDKSLSVNNSTSCGSCHKQQYAFGDNVAFSKGFDGGVARRNTMQLVDVPLGGQIKSSVQGPVLFGGLFWDGRSASLSDAVSQPIINHIEMGMANMSELAFKLEKLPYYRELFKETYGPNRRVDASDIQQALSFFVMSLDSRNTRFQEFKMGRGQLTSSELDGMRLFTSTYNCGSCHEAQLGIVQSAESVYNPTTIGFANIGLPGDEDKGLYEFTRREEHTGVFRIPNLNNIALTGPYMHDGSLATLEDVLDHYSESIQPHANLDARLRNSDKSPKRMNITAEEKTAIIAFLKTFTSDEVGNAPEFSNPFKLQ